jgi:hypothetical protein
MDCLPAKQSANFSFSPEKSKVPRGFAHFFDLRALQKLRFHPQQLPYARFSLPAIEPVPYCAVCPKARLKKARMKPVP